MKIEFINVTQSDDYTVWEVKVYARSEFELKTFKRVTEILRNAGNDIVAIEGHWMIINLS